MRSPSAARARQYALTGFPIVADVTGVLVFDLFEPRRYLAERSAQRPRRSPPHLFEVSERWLLVSARRAVVSATRQGMRWLGAQRLGNWCVINGAKNWIGCCVSSGGISDVGRYTLTINIGSAGRRLRRPLTFFHYLLFFLALSLKTVHAVQVATVRKFRHLAGLDTDLQPLEHDAFATVLEPASGSKTARRRLRCARRFGEPCG